MGFACETGEKPGNLRLAHLCRMALVVKEDEPLDPADIRFLCHVAIVPGPDCLADLVEQPWFCCAGRKRELKKFGIFRLTRLASPVRL